MFVEYVYKENLRKYLTLLNAVQYICVVKF